MYQECKWQTTLERSEYAPYIEQNKHNIDAYPETFKSAKKVSRTPLGNQKGSGGFNYIMTKKIDKKSKCWCRPVNIHSVQSTGLINIICKNEFKKYLEGLFECFLD